MPNKICVALVLFTRGSWRPSVATNVRRFGDMSSAAILRNSLSSEDTTCSLVMFSAKLTYSSVLSINDWQGL